MSTSSPLAPDPASAVDSAPSFLVGQDAEGRWIAVEVHGLFRSRAAAVHYARDESRGRADAVRLVAGPLALSIV